MKKIIGFFKNVYQWLLNLFLHKSNKELVLMSASLLLGLLWPVAGLVLFLIGKFVNDKFLDYGKAGLFGAAVNYLLYFVQIILRIAASI